MIMIKDNILTGIKLRELDEIEVIILSGASLLITDAELEGVKDYMEKEAARKYISIGLYYSKVYPGNIFTLLVNVLSIFLHQVGYVDSKTLDNYIPEGYLPDENAMVERLKEYVKNEDTV